MLTRLLCFLRTKRSTYMNFSFGTWFQSSISGLLKFPRKTRSSAILHHLSSTMSGLSCQTRRRSNTSRTISFPQYAACRPAMFRHLPHPNVRADISGMCGCPSTILVTKPRRRIAPSDYAAWDKIDVVSC